MEAEKIYGGKDKKLKHGGKEETEEFGIRK